MTNPRNSRRLEVAAKERPLLSKVRRSLSLSASITILIAAALLSAWFFSFALERTRANVEARATGAASRVDLYLDKHMTVVDGLAAVLADSDTAHRSPHLESIHQRYPGFLTMLIAGPEGRIHHAAPGSLEQSLSEQFRVSDRDYFKYADQTAEPFVSNAFEGRGFGSDPIVAVSQAFYVNGERMVVEGSLDLSHVGEYVENVLQSESLRYILRDADGRVVASNSGFQFLEYVLPEQIARMSKSYIVSERVLTSTGWSLLVGQDRTNLLSDTVKFATALLFALIAAQGIGILINTGALTPSLKWIANTSIELQKRRNEDIVIPPLPAKGRAKEISTLGASILDLLDTVAEHRASLQTRVGDLEKAVEERTQELQRTNQKLLQRGEMLVRFVEAAPVALALFDKKLCYLAASQKWLDDYRLDGPNIMGICHYDVFPTITDEWKQIHQRALHGESLSREEDRFVDEKGMETFLRWRVLPWYETNDEVGGLIMMSQDVTREIQQREVLLQRGASLERFNNIISDTSITNKSRRQQVLDLGCRILGVRMGIIASITDDCYRIEQVQCDIPDMDIERGLNLELKDTVCSHVVAENAPVLHFHDEDSREGMLHPAYVGFRPGSYIAARITLDKGQHWGTLNFSDTKPRAQPFDSSQISFVRILANWVGANLSAERASQRIQRQTNQLQTLMDALPLLVLFVNRDRSIEMANRHIAALRIPKRKARGMDLAQAVPKDIQFEVFRLVESAFSGTECKEDLRVEQLPGRVFSVEASPLSRRNRVEGVFFVVSDVTLERRRVEMLSRQALTDHLTGLRNRKAFSSDLGDLEPNAWCVVVIDLDKFKHINDQYGHAAGDAALCHVAEILRKNCRKTDTAYRFGGDEFVVLVRGELDGARRFATGVIEDLTRPCRTGQVSFRVQASLGLAMIERDASAAFEAADAAAYEAKKRGGGLFVADGSSDERS